MRIVLTSWGSFGDVFPYLGLALELRARGHRPLLAMPAFYRRVVEREGLEFYPIRPDVDPSDRAVVERLMEPKRGPEFLLKDIVMGSLRDSYHDLLEATRGADMLLTHPVTFAGPLVAERQDLPWASTVLAPMSFFSAHELPVFAPMPWAKPLERIPGMAVGLLRLVRAVTRRWSEPVHALRRELGLSAAAGDPIYEGQHSPRLVLALFSSVLAAPQPDWPPHVRITGAIPYNGPEAQNPLPVELENFLADGPAPVVFTLGSSAVGAAGDFYVESIAAVRRLGVRAVLLVGSQPENRPRAPLPQGVMLAEFSPHAALFPRAAAIVHQGGAGTLHQGLRSGRPTLVVPFSFDQADNAYRVERLGVSRTLAARRYAARRVERELKHLLRDDAHRQKAGEIARRVRAENGAAAAADAIEQHFVASAR